MNRRKAIFGTTSQFTEEEEEAVYTNIFVRVLSPVHIADRRLTSFIIQERGHER